MDEFDLMAAALRRAAPPPPAQAARRLPRKLPRRGPYPAAAAVLPGVIAVPNREVGVIRVTTRPDDAAQDRQLFSFARCTACGKWRVVPAAVARHLITDELFVCAALWSPDDGGVLSCEAPESKQLHELRRSYYVNEGAPARGSRQLDAARAVAADPSALDLARERTWRTQAGDGATRDGRVANFWAILEAAGCASLPIRLQHLQIALAAMVDGFFAARDGDHADEDAVYYKSADDALLSALAYHERRGEAAISLDDRAGLNEALARLRRTGAFSHKQSVGVRPADVSLLSGWRQAAVAAALVFMLRPGEFDTADFSPERCVCEEGVWTLKLGHLIRKSNEYDLAQARCLCNEAVAARRALCPCAFVPVLREAAGENPALLAEVVRDTFGTDYSGQGPRVGAVQTLLLAGAAPERIAIAGRWKCPSMVSLYGRKTRFSGAPDMIFNWLP